MKYLFELWDTLKEIADDKMKKIFDGLWDEDSKGKLNYGRSIISRIIILPSYLKYLGLYWLICEFSAAIYTIEGLLVNFSSREKMRPRFRMTFAFCQKLQKIYKLLVVHDQEEFYELVLVISRLSNPVHTRFAVYNTPKIVGK